MNRYFALLSYGVAVLAITLLPLTGCKDKTPPPKPPVTPTQTTPS